MAFRLLLLLALAQASAAGQSRSDALPLFTGQAVCVECHGPGKSANGCKARPAPGHLEAFRVLGTAPAEHISVLTGTVGPPDRSQLCLGCHATAADEGPRWRLPSFAIEDGVQCESCHGPGSLHADARRREPSAAELPHPAGIRRGDVEDCQSCHRSRASHDEVLRNGFRVPPADRLYKTPVNLAVSRDGGRVYVACEHADALVVIDASRQAVVGEVRVGSRPHGVTVSPDGSRVYVTNRFSGSMSVVDASTLAVVAEVRVGADPHGVTTSASGDRIFVLNTGDHTVSVVDASSLMETKRLAAGEGPWAAAPGGRGGYLFASSVRPVIPEFREPHRSEVTIIAMDTGVVAKRVMLPDANMLQGVAAVPGTDAVLVTLMRTKDLVPATRLSQGWVITNGLGVVRGDGSADEVLLDEPNRCFPDPTDVDVSPDGRLAAVTSGGADEVALVDVPGLLGLIGAASAEERADVLPNHLGMSSRFVVARIPVGSNPRSAAFSPDGTRIFVAEALDDAVAVIDVAGRRVESRIMLGGPEEITEIRMGERLFHSAASTHGRQFSCRSCHPDGHTNGLSLDIEADGIGLHPVDNRSLRGIFDTQPFKWEGTNPTIARQCGPRFSVFFTRLDPEPPEKIDALARYVTTIERPPNPVRDPDGLTLSQRRGKAVFERTVSEYGTPIPRSQRCSSCHDGSYHSSGQREQVGTTMWFDASVEAPLDLHDAAAFGALGAAMFEDHSQHARFFDVAHLTNIHDSPPFLHNGAAKTLEEIWTRYNLYQRHGVTHDLTRRQLNDLIAYLRTL